MIICCSCLNNYSSNLFKSFVKCLDKMILTCIPNYGGEVTLRGCILSYFLTGRFTDLTDFFLFVFVCFVCFFSPKQHSLYMCLSTMCRFWKHQFYHSSTYFWKLESVCPLLVQCNTCQQRHKFDLWWIQLNQTEKKNQWNVATFKMLSPGTYVVQF